jgi:MraZ protein
MWSLVVKSGDKNVYLPLKNIFLALIGTYECKLDAKGRLILPQALRKQLLAYGSGEFVLKRSVFEKALELYPKGEWESVFSAVNKLNRFVRKNAQFIRSFTAGVKLLEIEESGRLTVTKDLVHFAGLKKELVLVACGNMIEIWDKLCYEKAIALTEEEFSSLAETVMGEKEEADGV